MEVGDKVRETTTGPDAQMIGPERKIIKIDGEKYYTHPPVIDVLTGNLLAFRRQQLRKI